MAEHGGDLDRAISHYGGARHEWIDLSTGINPHAYPLSDIDKRHWTDLPDANTVNNLISAAQDAYHTKASILPMAGAQQAINAYPSIRRRGKARILGPTYNEHNLQLSAKGWDVSQNSRLDELAGADLAVIVNPNNPDGQSFTPDKLAALAQKTGLLIIDESFVDVHPELSLCPHITEAHDNILVLRSFGKFYGLAGMRLGFAIGTNHLLEPLKAHQGSWAVSGPALAIGAAALRDKNWAQEMRARLAKDAERLDSLAIQAGWDLKGGCSLFRLYDVGDATTWQDRLATRHIWSRRFSYATRWLRLGLPSDEGWERLSDALTK